MKKLLFFPIEIKSRELMPRLLMSLFALKKNYYCFIEVSKEYLERPDILVLGIIFISQLIYDRPSTYKKD